MPETKDGERDLQEYLARIRKTVAESQALVSQAELRMAETDRLLESQGLTREQVMALRFSEEQREVVNAELVRLGMEPIQEDDGFFAASDGAVPLVSSVTHPDMDGDLAERQRKFGMMMKPFQI
ncbi:MAG: hypothetical protein IJR99_08890 [Kiritimatiellae bacterium]|nr:hypothetical protein [Kiritimatiellia bacterium]